MTTIPPAPPPVTPAQPQPTTVPTAPSADTPPAPPPAAPIQTQQPAQTAQAPQPTTAPNTAPTPPTLPAAAPAPAATIAPTLIDALVVRAPQATTIQPAPITLPAIVAEVQTDGIARLLTTIGDFDVQTAQPLPIGQKLAIPLPAGPLPDTLYLKLAGVITLPATANPIADTGNQALLNPKGLLQTVRAQIDNVIQKITAPAVATIATAATIPSLQSLTAPTTQLRLWVGQILQSAPAEAPLKGGSIPITAMQTPVLQNAAKTAAPVVSQPMQPAISNKIITVPFDSKSIQLAQHLTAGITLPPLPNTLSSQSAATAAQQLTVILVPQTIKITGIAPTFTPHAPALTMQQNAAIHAVPTQAQAAPALPTQAPVIGFTQEGLPVLGFMSDDGVSGQRPLLFVVTTPVTVKAGQWVNFEATGTQLMRLGLPQIATQTPSTTPPSAESTWPLLSALDDMLADDINADVRTGPTPLMQLLQQTIPRPSAMLLTPPMLLLLSALKGGDIQGWIGRDGMETLKAHAKNAAFDRLKSGFESAVSNRRNEPDSPANEWKSVSLPLLTGYEISRILLHTRSFAQNENENGKDPQKSTRFVMDLSFSRIGPMQLEGFVTARQLDVTVRSEHDFSAPMRDELRARYRMSVEAVGYAGRLHFHASTDHKGWLKI